MKSVFSSIILSPIGGGFWFQCVILNHHWVLVLRFFMTHELRYLCLLGTIVCIRCLYLSGIWQTMLLRTDPMITCVIMKSICVLKTWTPLLCTQVNTRTSLRSLIIIISTPNLKFIMIIFVVRNCWLEETLLMMIQWSELHVELEVPTRGINIMNVTCELISYFAQALYSLIWDFLLS